MHKLEKQPRKIGDLASISDELFFEQISIGYERILENSNRLANVASQLSRQSYLTESRILSLTSDEEAAKCLILLDAVRCPREDSSLLRKHLRKCYSHSAKGIYVGVCEWSYGDYTEFRNYIEDARKETSDDYIGENIVEVFPNPIFTERLDMLYVDYVSIGEGKYVWEVPKDNPLLEFNGSMVSDLANAFYDSGCTQKDALMELANYWHQIQIEKELPWAEFQELTTESMNTLISHNLIADNKKDISKIVELWPYPMFSFDLNVLKQT